MTRTRTTKPRAAKPAAQPPTLAPEKESKQRKQPDVSPEAQAIIERIRVMYVDEGLGFPSIANKLNAEGIKPFRTGVKWYPPVVRNIVKRNGWTKGDKKATDTAAA